MPPSAHRRLKVFSGLAILFSIYSLFGHHANLMESSNPTTAENSLLPPDHRPLLRSVLNFTSAEVIGDPQFLLDFAIIGFPKCGTTALQAWLSSHSEIEMLPGEVFSLLNEQPARFIWRLYTQLTPSPQVVRGYKNPLDIRAPQTLKYFTQLFPKTTLIVGIRHPVRWFESLYNFKVQNLPSHVNPSYWGDPNNLIHACAMWNETNCVGTAKGVSSGDDNSIFLVTFPPFVVFLTQHFFLH